MSISRKRGTFFAPEASSPSDSANNSLVSYSTITKKSYIGDRLTLLITGANSLRITGNGNLSKKDMISGEDLDLVQKTIIFENESPKELSMMSSSFLNQIKKSFNAIYGKRLRAKCCDWMTSEVVDETIVNHIVQHISDENVDTMTFVMLDGRPINHIYWIINWISKIMIIDTKDPEIDRSIPELSRMAKAKRWEFDINGKLEHSHPLMFLFEIKTDKLSDIIVQIINHLNKAFNEDKDKYQQYVYATVSTVIGEYCRSVQAYLNESLDEARKHTKGLNARRTSGQADPAIVKKLESIDVSDRMLKKMQSLNGWMETIFGQLWKDKECVSCLTLSKLLGSGNIFGYIPTGRIKSTNNVSMFRSILPIMDYWTNMCRSPTNVKVFDDAGNQLNKPDAVILGNITRSIFTGLTSEENGTVQVMKIYKDDLGQMYVENTSEHREQLYGHIYTNALTYALMGARKIEIRNVKHGGVTTLMTIMLPKTTPQYLNLNGPIAIIKSKMNGQNLILQKDYGVEPFIVTEAHLSIDRAAILELVRDVLTDEFKRHKMSEFATFKTSRSSTSVFLETKPDVNDELFKSKLTKWINESQDFLIKSQSAIGNFIARTNPHKKADIEIVMLLKLKGGFVYMTPIKLKIDTTNANTSEVINLTRTDIAEKVFTSTSAPSTSSDIW